MACPHCGCKVHYQFNGAESFSQDDERMERCASCGAIFDIEDSADEDDGPPDCAPGTHEIDPDNGGCRKCFAALGSAGNAGVVTGRTAEE